MEIKDKDKADRYAAIKARMRAGKFVFHEDFLFVKALDQATNGMCARNRLSMSRVDRDAASGGFNTVKD